MISFVWIFMRVSAAPRAAEDGDGAEKDAEKSPPAR
jgi:hypothetical protein